MSDVNKVSSKGRKITQNKAIFNDTFVNSKKNMTTKTEREKVDVEKVDVEEKPKLSVAESKEIAEIEQFSKIVLMIVLLMRKKK